MVERLIKKIFDVREGEFKVSLWMLAYIFLVIAVLLIIKPTVNALFLSELGIEQLPFAFLLVAVTAVATSYFYSRAVSKFPLKKVIETTLISSIIILIGLGILLSLNVVSGILLYFFYIWVAIYAVLSASQFWVLANLVFNIREAKRLFGFIGSGAIIGGIFGGYLTSILAPLIGNENLMFVASLLLFFCIPLLRKIWHIRVKKNGSIKKHKTASNISEAPLRLILKSKHLTYIACIVAVSVVVAKLVDYLFSEFASTAFTDADELTAFFAFWFSTFNLLSLVIQLFFTHRIVGIWGVGFSLLLLPLGIFGGSMLFLMLPELSAVVVIKAMDGVLKQSIHKSASELLTLPLPFDLKNRTKSFIDVVVDSLATGIAGCLLIFVVRGLDLPSIYIGALIIALVCLWLYFIYKVRIEYYKTFRSNLEMLTDSSKKTKKISTTKVSVVSGMRTVFANGTEAQILFMLDKLMEINDKRFAADVEQLLGHPSNKVKLSAIQNLYFLNSKTMTAKVSELLLIDDRELTIATLAYILSFAHKDKSFVFDAYLEHSNERIAMAALYCLARAAKNNYSLKQRYGLVDRISKAIDKINDRDDSYKEAVIEILGIANLPLFYNTLGTYLYDDSEHVVRTTIKAIGTATDSFLVQLIIPFLIQKKYRATVMEAFKLFGPSIIPLLGKQVQERKQPLEVLRFIPAAIQSFHSKESVHQLLGILTDNDLTVRLEVVRALSAIRASHPYLKFNRYKVVSVIFDECKLHHQTLSAMHTQIIISYRNRTKSKKEITDAERDARTSLLELLERRLDTGLERIFKLLGLRYQQKDVAIAYEGLLSQKQEAQQNAIEFLDNLLTGELKRKLLPIIEESAMDISSEEELQKIKHKIPTELECFKLLLQGNDLKIKLAVLYLIAQQKEPKFLPMVEGQLNDPDPKIRSFALNAFTSLSPQKP
ncbi:Npt1/Npt2 family nucleotide transporter [Maribacter confluentis]|uniref:ADP,ATP carrier protein n=1 Tax=Maribacter confluentis TaxID=1656093 RepID=A0ABT8RS54_9FLAO|nr:Npt1/Npt2 family nucleotide transporter [Maribacter confluentis]MDO1513755.1 Npt1/Npt2 family nucleotide transporter [Maribacter confluentis]